MPKTVEQIAALLEQGRVAFRAGDRSEEGRIHQLIVEMARLSQDEREEMDGMVLDFMESRRGVGPSLSVALHLVSKQGERRLDQLAGLVQPILEQHIAECFLCQEEYEEGVLSSRSYNYNGSWG